MSHTTRRTARIALCALALAALRAPAISDTDFQGAINYDFRPPGARSLGLAGAFTALADDATTAQLNPAGLIQLRKPEFSFVAKAWTEDMHLNWGSGSYTDLSGYNSMLPAASREERDFYSTKAAPAFLSYAFPYKRVAFSFYYARPVEFSNEFARDELAAGPLFIEDCSFGPPCTTFFAGAANAALTLASGKMRLERLGAAMAIDFGHHFSMGVTVFSGRMDYKARSVRYEPTTTVTDDRATLIVEERSLDRRNGAAIGLLYSGDVWRAGLTFQRGERFRATVKPIAGPRLLGQPLRSEFTTDLKVPDRTTLAVAWRPLPLLTLSAEAEHIRWSQQLSRFRSIQASQAPAAPDDPNEFDSGAYEIDDALNPHLGAEYVVLADTSPLSVRAGVWWERGHRLKYVGHASEVRIDLVPGVVTLVVPGETTDNIRKMLYPGGGSQQHYTAGIGFVVGKLQFDAAYDYSKWNRQFALSAIYRLP